MFVSRCPPRTLISFLTASTAPFEAVGGVTRFSNACVKGCVIWLCLGLQPSPHFDIALPIIATAISFFVDVMEVNLFASVVILFDFFAHVELPFEAAPVDNSTSDSSFSWWPIEDVSSHGYWENKASLPNRRGPRSSDDNFTVFVSAGIIINQVGVFLFTSHLYSFSPVLETSSW